MLSSGTRLGVYEIVSLIGAGGMGQVYLARDTRLGRNVAIKILPDEFTSDAMLRLRFEREARTISSLSHPRLCTLYDVGHHEGASFLVMEYIEGETLAARLERGPLAFPIAIGIVEQIAEALEEAHAKGITHRDLKPANIMITPRGDVKVLDFGLAKSVERDGPAGVADSMDAATAVRSSPGVIVGSLPYMSPEQLKALPVDARSDLFSLGAMFFEMTAGRRPFEGSSAAELIANILRTDPPSVSAVREDAPAGIDGLVRKLMEKQPDRRYQSAGELLVDLRLIGSTAGRSARPRALRMALFAALVVVAALAALIVSMFLSSRRDESRRVDSLAVLPFQNVSRDAQLDYLADGLAENTIEHLSRIGGLRVMARSTSFQYRGQRFDPLKIGRDLKVAAILTGDVIQQDEVLTLSAELVDASDGSRIWGTRYKGDALSIQQRLTADLSRVLGPEDAQMDRAITVDHEVFRLYLQGRHALNKWTPGSERTALQYFDRAIQRDPTYAPAHAGIAAAYVTFEPYSGSPAREWLPRARAAATRAMELDSGLAEAYATLAMVDFNSFEWAAAEKNLRRAIRLNPSYAAACDWYSQYLVTMGRVSEALRMAERAQKLDPLSPTINANVAACRLMTGDMERGIAELKRLADKDADFPLAWQWLAFGYLQTRQYDLALQALHREVETSGRHSLALVNLAFGYARAGKTADARRLAEEVIERSAREHVEGIVMAGAFVAIGDDEKALDWLERGAEERIGTMTYVTWPPWFDHLKTHPRYLAVLQDIGLGESGSQGDS